MPADHMRLPVTSATRPDFQTSPAVANQIDDLLRSGQPAGLFFGIDFVPVNEDVQLAWPAHSDSSGNLQFAFDAVFQAHGPCLDVASKETALDFDGHSGLLQILLRFRIAASCCGVWVGERSGRRQKRDHR